MGTSRAQASSGVAVAMLGARMHYAVPVALSEAALLTSFFTDNYIGNKPKLEGVLRGLSGSIRAPGLHRWLGRRSSSIPPEKVSSFEAFGFWYLYQRRGLGSDYAHQRLMLQVEPRFGSLVCGSGFGQAGAVWAYDSEALTIFTAARSQNRKCLLEQAILPRPLWFEMVRSEHAKWPGWEEPLQDAGSDAEIFAHEAMEWELADIVVAGSSFVAEGLTRCGVPARKVRTIPYGVSTDRFAGRIRIGFDGSRPLRALFVGTVGLRKGVPYLFEALRTLGPRKVHCKVAGPIVIAQDRLDQYRAHVEILGPVPRNHVPRLYDWADVFILPSIVEGSATVVYEALLSGLPVICTPNAGSIVEHGVHGLIVSAGDSDALADALNTYINEPNLVSIHSEAALSLSPAAGLTRYGSEVVKLCREVTGE